MKKVFGEIREVVENFLFRAGKEEEKFGTTLKKLFLPLKKASHAISIHGKCMTSI